MNLDFPPEFFKPPAKRPENWPDHPHVRACVDWLKSFLVPSDWNRRRENAAHRLYAAAMGNPSDPNGRFFDETDMAAWYLFQAEAYVDHIWNYEPMFGSRVVPVFAAIGKEIEAISNVPGVDQRVKRLLTSERAQPNAGLFELLVAKAYIAEGAEVKFVPEAPGRKKTHDLDALIDGQNYAVECKRMETSEQGERERQWSTRLWLPAADELIRADASALCDITFIVSLDKVPTTYLRDKVALWANGRYQAIEWEDEFAVGAVKPIDLTPLREVLENDTVLASSTRLHELLTGTYKRHDNIKQFIRYKASEWNPRWLSECDFAAIFRYQCIAQESIDAKARDVLKKLADGNEQLPDDRPGLIHVGFESVDGDEVERRRHERIVQSASDFDPKGKDLRWAFCHYFVPECPPDNSWAFDETVQWCGIRNHNNRLPLENLFLIVPPEVDTDFRFGGHWDRET